METSIFLAQILAVFYVTASLGCLLNPDYCRKLYQEFAENAGLLYLGGLVALAAGFSMIHFHNIWVKNWTVIITIFGWLAMIKGITLIIFPKPMIRLTRYLMNKGIEKAYWITLALGLILGYFGFIA